MGRFRERRNEIKKLPLKDRPGWQKFKAMLPGIAGGIAELIPGGGAISTILKGIKDESTYAKEAREAADEFLLPIEVEEAENDLSDLRHAREMEEQRMLGADWFTRNIAGILAIIWTLVTAVIFLVLFFFSNIADPEMKHVILASVKDIEIMVMMFYFGSSIGSKIKTEILKKAEPV